MDLRLLWYTPLSYVEKDIEAQKTKTQEASDELKDASNSYEMTPFNGITFFLEGTKGRIKIFIPFFLPLSPQRKHPISRPKLGVKLGTSCLIT